MARYRDSQGNYTGPVGVQSTTAAAGTSLTSAAQEIVNRMNRNAQSWYTDHDNKSDYEKANQSLSQQLNSLGYRTSYDSAAGTWTVSGGKRSSSGSSDNLSETADGYYSAGEQLIREQDAAALRQQQAKIDYATKQSIDALNRSQADANAQYADERDSVWRDERQALDNSALYAEVRGDRGGIGRQQYDSIANTAARSVSEIDRAQIKLASDTARQIAELRAEGEYQKADAVLQQAQSELASLLALRQQAQTQALKEAELGLSQQKQEDSLAQWGKEYQLSLAKLQTQQRESEAAAKAAEEKADRAELEARAKTLAQYGDFSGYRALGYTEEEIALMRTMWARKNPKIAW